MERNDLGRVIYEKEDSGVARLILNYPERANLQDSEMVWAFDKALGLAEYDYDVKVLRLVGPVEHDHDVQVRVGLSQNVTQRACQRPANTITKAKVARPAEKIHAVCVALKR